MGAGVAHAVLGGVVHHFGEHLDNLGLDVGGDVAEMREVLLQLVGENLGFPHRVEGGGFQYVRSLILHDGLLLASIFPLMLVFWQICGFSWA